MVYNHVYGLPKHFHHPKGQPHAQEVVSLHSLLSAPDPTNLHAVSKELSIMTIS